VINIPLDGGIINKIKQIERNYLFKSNFNLTKYLLELPDILSGVKLLSAMVSRPAKVKKIMDEVVKLTDKLVACLAGMPELMKIDVDQLPGKIDKLYGDINITLENPNWNISQFQKDTEILNRICYIRAKYVRKDDGRNPPNSKPKILIHRLAVVFYQGTGRFPECKHDRSSDEYTGDFYEFLFDIEPVMKLLAIQLGTRKTVGRYVSVG